MDVTTTVLLGSIAASTGCIAGATLGREMKRFYGGAILGLLFGPLGLVVLLLIGPADRAVPSDGPQNPDRPKY